MPAESSSRTAKAELRVWAKAARRDAFARIGAAAAEAVRARAPAILPLAPAIVAAYWPMNDELDVRPMIGALVARGNLVALPVIQGRDRPLIFRRYVPGDALVAAAFGTSEPAADRPTLVPHLVIAPLLAFDRAGYRLGYGGGYYDRTLNALRKQAPTIAIGVGFAAQEVREIPREPSDARLDWIVTERETFTHWKPRG